MSTPSVESATERAVLRHRKEIGRIPRRPTLAPQKRTKATLYTVSQLLETYKDPRAVLLEIAAMDTAALAELAKCSLLDALQERRLCAQAVLPYVAQKLPAQVDMRHSRAIHLNIVTDDQYQELVKVAQEPGDDAQSISAQLVNGLGTESTTDETAESGTGVGPAVATAPHGADARTRKD